VNFRRYLLTFVTKKGEIHSRRQFSTKKREAKLPPTETWLVDPLLFYTEAAQLDDAVQYFKSLRDALIQKLTLAIHAKEKARDVEARRVK
jgi:hypothetical protein